MDKNRVLQRIAEEEDFVNSPKHGYSLARVVQENPDGVKDKAAARMLCCTEDEVQRLYDEAVEQIRETVRE